MLCIHVMLKFHQTVKRSLIIAGRTYMMMPMIPKTNALHWRNFFRVYQSRHSEKAVMISLTVEDKREINDQLRPTNVLLDLDNFGEQNY
jgi:hypothetical protein